MHVCAKGNEHSSECVCHTVHVLVQCIWCVCTTFVQLAIVWTKWMCVRVYCGNTSAAGEKLRLDNMNMISLLRRFITRTHIQLLVLAFGVKSHAFSILAMPLWGRYTLKFGCIQMEPLAILSTSNSLYLFICQFWGFFFHYKHFCLF